MAAPTCRMDKIITTKANRPALAKPANFSPIPNRKACTSAMPITPWETERMVFPASATKSSLRSGNNRAMMDLLASTSRGPDGSRKPAKITATTNLSAPRPMPPTMASVERSSGFRWGASWVRTASRLVDAWFHRS